MHWHHRVFLSGASSAQVAAIAPAFSTSASST
jgi:hypothetical protein